MTTLTLPERVLTVRQPWADLIMAGVKDVENRSWPVPSTLPEHLRCNRCHVRVEVGSRWGPSRMVCEGRRHSGSLLPDGPFPFTLGIHAAKQRDDRPNYVGRGEWWEFWQGTVGRFGVLLGRVTVTGCHHADECDKIDGDLITGVPVGTPDHCSRWAEPDVYHWTFAEPEPLTEPVPMKGRLGLWSPNASTT